MIIQKCLIVLIQIHSRSRQNIFTFIRHFLEYAALLWDKHMAFSILSKTENAQLDTAIINTELTGLVSLNNLCSETGWEEINDRRENHIAVQL